MFEMAEKYIFVHFRTKLDEKLLNCQIVNDRKFKKYNFIIFGVNEFIIFCEKYNPKVENSTFLKFASWKIIILHFFVQFQTKKYTIIPESTKLYRYFIVIICLVSF